MKEKILIVLFMVLLLVLSAFVICDASEFVHPLDFKGTNAEKANVINYIKDNVKETYSKIGMDTPSTLRMMEKKNLDCFKKLTKAENRELLDKIIKTYCGIGMCNYSTILMMYDNELKASKKKLDW